MTMLKKNSQQYQKRQTTVSQQSRQAKSKAGDGVELLQQQVMVQF